MMLTRRSNLSSTLLTCCGRHRGLLQRALRRVRSSWLHQRVLRLLEVDPSVTSGAADASWLQRELRVVTKRAMLKPKTCETEAVTVRTSTGGGAELEGSNAQTTEF